MCPAKPIETASHRSHARTFRRVAGVFFLRVAENSVKGINAHSSFQLAMKPCRWPRDAILSVTISSVVLAQPSIMESDPRPFGESTVTSDPHVNDASRREGGVGEQGDVEVHDSSSDSSRFQL